MTKTLDDIKLTKDYKPIRRHRFLLEFPYSHKIPDWQVKKIEFPDYTPNSLQKKKLIVTIMQLMSDCDIYTFADSFNTEEQILKVLKIKYLDEMGVNIMTVNYLGVEIEKVVFDSLDYDDEGHIKTFTIIFTYKKIT